MKIWLLCVRLEERFRQSEDGNNIVMGCIYGNSIKNTQNNLTVPKL